MDTNIQVKMEYPFPANEVSWRAKQWREELDTNDVETAVEAKTELDSCVRQALIDSRPALREALEIADTLMLDDDRKLMITAWEGIESLTQVIRCLESRSNVSGEMIGLYHLMETLSKE